MYHNVSLRHPGLTDERSAFDVSQRLFEQQLDMIGDLGLTGCAVGSAVADSTPDRVGITFDDGDAGQFDHASHTHSHPFLVELSEADVFAEIGYQLMGTSRWGANPVDGSLSGTDSPVLVRRCTIRGAAPVDYFKQVLSGDPWLAMRRRLRYGLLRAVRTTLDRADTLDGGDAC